VAKPTRLLDEKIRAALQAVVVDANAYGAAGPDLARLTRLAADLAKINIRTWVPEPVAWEWAEHLAAEWSTIRTVAKMAAGRLSTAGLPNAATITLGLSDRILVIQEFLRLLAEVPHVEVIPLSGESAIEGLKDQILLRDPAKPKGDAGVKTGGSDSAWIREVLAQAGTPDALLFLSQDRDIKRAFQVWGLGEPLMRTTSTLRPSLVEDVPASTNDQWLVARYLVGHLPMDLDDTAPDTDQQLVGSNTQGLLDAIDLDWQEHGWTGGRLTKLTALAGVSNVVCEAAEVHEPGKAPDTRTVRATAFFLADAEATVVYSFGDDEPASESTSNHTDLIARTRLVLQVRGSEVVSVRADSDTFVFSPSRYHDYQDAIEEVTDVLTSVPGLELPNDWGGWENDGEQQLTIHGTDQVAELHWEHGDYGGLAVWIGTDAAHVSCEYDDSTWIGGRDGFHVEPPYSLTTETPSVSSAGAWPLSAWMILRLLEQEPNEPTAPTNH